MGFESKIVPSWSKIQEKQQERCWPLPGLRPSVVHIVAFKDRLTPTEFVTFFFFINLESRQNNFHTLLISSELRKDTDIPEFFLFSLTQEQTSFPWHVALDLWGTCGVCAWQIVTGQNTRLQNCCPCLIFSEFYFMYSENYRDSQRQNLIDCPKTYTCFMLFLERRWKYSSFKTNHDVSVTFTQAWKGSGTGVWGREMILYHLTKNRNKKYKVKENCDMRRITDYK